MKIKTNISAKKILIWSGVFATVGVSGYLIYKAYGKWKKKQDDKLQALQDQIANLPKGNTATSGGASSGGSSSVPSELNSVAKIKAFQDWCDSKDYRILPPSASNPKWSKLNKGAGYGTFRKNTKIAWEMHKDEYLKSLKDGGASSTTSTDSTTAFTSKELALAISRLKASNVANTLTIDEKGNPYVVFYVADTSLDNPKAYKVVLYNNDYFQIWDMRTDKPFFKAGGYYKNGGRKMTVFVDGKPKGTYETAGMIDTVNSIIKVY